LAGGREEHVPDTLVRAPDERDHGHEQEPGDQQRKLPLDRVPARARSRRNRQINLPRSPVRWRTTRQCGTSPMSRCG
jgi:hypothetical protein